VTDKQRKKMFESEMSQMTSVAKALMESVSHAKVEFTSARHHEHVRPMFKVKCWRLRLLSNVPLSGGEISSLFLYDCLPVVSEGGGSNTSLSTRYGLAWGTVSRPQN